MTRHFLRDDDLSPEQQAAVLDLAAQLKAAPYDERPLAGPRTVAVLFDKPTLRTQASFASGIAELGGFPMIIDGTLAQIGVRESDRRHRPGARSAGVGRSCGAPTSSPGSRRWPRTPAYPS